MIAAIVKAALAGVWTGLYPIGLVIVAALFTYAIVAETGGMSEIRRAMMGISDDIRVTVLLVVWGYGNFMEGMAGFGTAVAIPAALLVGIGFDPVKSVVCSLVANTTATAYGSLGVCTMVLAGEAGCELATLSGKIAAMQLAVTALGPFLVLLAADGWRGVRERWGTALLADVAFIVPWYALAQVGCELPDIAGGLAVMVALVLGGGWRSLDGRRQLRAWAPFLAVIAALAVGALLPKECKISPGFLVLAAAIPTGLAQGIGLKRLMSLLGGTVWRYRKALITICTVLAFAKVLGTVGAIRFVADRLVAIAGSAYPLVAPMVGAIGGAITGSGTSSSVLFGALQASVANGDTALTLVYAGANAMGAGIGKMICIQSLVLGCAAAGIAGGKAKFYAKTLCFFVPALAIAALTSYLFARWL